LGKPADEFQDTHVLAFRKIETEKSILNKQNASIKSYPEVRNLNNLWDGDIKTEALL